jgi:voltage-gated potassium channel
MKRLPPDSAADMLRRELKALLQRLVLPLTVVAFVFVVGTVGYRILGTGRWGWLDCFYMTSITMTTVGYGEVLPGMGDWSRIFSSLLMWVSMAVMVYATAVVTAFIVEEHLGQFFVTRRAIKVISQMKDHYILVGAGRAGSYALGELAATSQKCVVIEKEASACHRVRKSFPDMPILEKDVLHEDSLLLAGVERARGVITTLREDGNNLIVVVNGRFLNSRVRIAARCSDRSLVERFRRAGADYVVSPDFIGGMRLASEMIRPHVTGFLDRMLRGQGNTRVEEAQVRPGSSLEGKTLAECGIYEKTGLRPIAVSLGGKENFIYNPDDATVLEAESIILVIARAEEVKKLRRMAGLE